MAHEVITNRNVSKGLEEIFFYVNDISNGLFMNGILVTVWVVVAFGVYFAQRNETASGNFPISAATAGFVTSVVAILFRIIPASNVPLVSTQALGVVLVISFLSVLWAWLTTKQ